MDKLIPVLVVLGIILCGFISKIIELRRISLRIDFTHDYREKFIKYVNEIIAQHNINYELYYELTSKAKEMQYELGEDGIVAFMKDNLDGYATKNYQLLINFLPETHEMLDEYALPARYNTSIRTCDDMFIRHLGTLEKEKKSIGKGIINPFSSFAEGIKSIILLPFTLMNWFGFISTEKTNRVRKNVFVKVLNIFVATIGFVSAVFTIVIGWNDFLRIILDFYHK